jgi:hypothetical protein
MHLTTIGVATGAQAMDLLAGETATWFGQTVSDATTLVMYTYLGDADLNGRINGDDYFNIDSHVQTAGASGWANGDFNYDGRIDGDDYFLIDSTLGRQRSVLSTGAGPSLGTVALVPEPVAFPLIVLLAGTAMVRKQKRARPAARSSLLL